jgi:hypothetical protein
MMGVSRHEGQPFFLCPLEKNLDEIDQTRHKGKHLVAKVEAHIQGDLVIPAPAGMHLSPGFNSYGLNEETLDI